MCAMYTCMCRSIVTVHFPALLVSILPCWLVIICPLCPNISVLVPDWYMSMQAGRSTFAYSNERMDPIVGGPD